MTGLPASTLGSVLLSDGATAVTGNTTYSLAQIQGMKFKPGTNASGTGTFTFTVTDNGTTGGVSDPKTLAQSLSITVTPVAAGTVFQQGTDSNNLVSIEAEDYTSKTSQGIYSWQPVSYTLASGQSQGLPTKLAWESEIESLLWAARSGKQRQAVQSILDELLAGHAIK